jgi:hypothetical protein
MDRFITTRGGGAIAGGAFYSIVIERRAGVVGEIPGPGVAACGGLAVLFFSPPTFSSDIEEEGVYIHRRRSSPPAGRCHCGSRSKTSVARPCRSRQRPPGTLANHPSVDGVPPAHLQRGGGGSGEDAW